VLHMVVREGFPFKLGRSVLFCSLALFSSLSSFSHFNLALQSLFNLSSLSVQSLPSISLFTRSGLSEAVLFCSVRFCSVLLCITIIITLTHILTPPLISLICPLLSSHLLSSHLLSSPLISSPSHLISFVLISCHHRIATTKTGPFGIEACKWGRPNQIIVHWYTYIHTYIYTHTCVLTLYYIYLCVI